jgi:3-oxoacyl-[acyl-carrier protein] reductase
MIPAVQLMRAWIPGMQARRFGRVINITSAMVKSPHYVMGLSTSARTALTAMSKAISTNVVADNVTINNLLPERIDTPRQDFMAQRMMAEHGIDRDEAFRRIAETIAAKRLGRPEEFGAACAFLCSTYASYISGQNLQLDGGSYEGLI